MIVAVPESGKCVVIVQSVKPSVVTVLLSVDDGSQLHNELSRSEFCAMSR